METLNRVTAEMPIVADKAIAREGMLTRAAAGKQITAVSDKLDHQLTALRTDLFARVDTIEKDPSSRSIRCGSMPTSRLRTHELRP